jgi:tight adherence protein B
VAVLTVIIATAGISGAVALARAARRAEAGGHVRGLAGPSRWRLPPPLRAWLAGALSDATIDLEPEAATELWLGAIGALALIGFGFAPGLTAPLIVVGLVGGPVALRVARGRARQRFATAVPGALEHVAAGLRGGASVADAIATLAEGTGVLAADLRRVRARAGLGLGLADALTTWPLERDVPSARAAAGALALAVTVGGPAADAIDGLATSLRERLAAGAEARALSAQARLSAVVVGGAPVAYLAVSAIVDPGSVAVLVGTGNGRVCLVLGLALEALALVWMRRLVRDEAFT